MHAEHSQAKLSSGALSLLPEVQGAALRRGGSHELNQMGEAHDDVPRAPPFNLLTVQEINKEIQTTGTALAPFSSPSRSFRLLGRKEAKAI